MKRYNIILLTGGISAEREVALASSKSMLNALREKGYEVKVVDPVYGVDQPDEDKIFSKELTKDYPDPEYLKSVVSRANKNILSCINSDIFSDTDIVVLGLHGKFGEDGVIQSLLDMRGVKYTGSGFVSSALCLDKHYSKVLFKYNEIPTPSWFTIGKNATEDINSVYKNAQNEVGFPLVIKPNDEGSTVGLKIFHTDDGEKEFEDAVNLAFSYSDKVMIEKYIKGKELTCTIIGNQTFPIIEIIPKDGFYDYEHKYTKGMTEYICPALLDEDVEQKIYDYSLKAYNSLGCEVYARIDFILNESNEPSCLEINTLPGMTETSLVPKSARAKGLEFPELLEKLIELSLKK